MKPFLGLFILLFCNNLLYSQQDYSLHFLKQVPQSKNTNPAFSSISKWNIGAPVISSVGYSFYNGLNLNDIFKINEEDSLQFDWEKVISKTKPKGNIINFDLNTDIIRIGYQYNRQFEYQFNITENLSYKGNYTKSLIQFLAYGQKSFLGGIGDFSDNSISFMHYREFGFGVTKTANTKIKIGARVKLLFGKSNIDLKPGVITLKLDSANYGYSSHIQPDLNIAGLDSTFDYSFVGNSNFGLGVDLGLNYTPNKKLNIAFSIIDLGQIKWTDKVSRYVATTTKNNYNGLDLNSILDTSSNTATSNITDSLNVLGFDTLRDSYKTMLPVKFYLSSTYNVFKKVQIGALLYGEVVHNYINPAVTFQIQKKIREHASIMLTYSLFNNSYTNIGFGYSLNIEPFQIYFTSNSIPSFIDYENSSNFDFHFGMNILLGVEHDLRLRYKRKKSKKKVWKGY